METSELALDHFEPLIGETFVADFGEQGTLDLVLVEALSRPTGSPQDVAFALMFQGPASPVFDQGLVPLEHAAIGSHSLFLVPIAHDEAGRRYEAVFTRIIE